MKIFLSCVSPEFRSYRLRLANQLGALKGTPHEVKVQEDFLQGGHTLLDTLSDYVRDCDLVIHLVGDACGARPTAEHERKLLRHLGEPDSTSTPGWSFTQWEYHLARRYGKRMLVYFATSDAPRDYGLTGKQSDDDAKLQQAHAQHIRDSGKHRGAFASHHHFIKEVFHDLGLEPDLKVNNLPGKTLGSLFKGRDEFLGKIRTTLGEAEHRGHRRVAAITATATAASVHGLGGIGKTRAAVEFGLRHAADYIALLFVQADSPAKLDENLAALCGPLVLDLPENDAKETEVRVAATLKWLQQHPGWLLIFDSVDTEGAAKAVEALLGRLTTAGQVIITSRLSRWSGSVVSLALDVLTVSDATDFLLERTQGHRRPQPDDPDRARELAELLGQLALALEQAGAYIVTNRFTFDQYLEAWRTHHDAVLEWFDERQMQYPRSVAVTWQTSVDQLTPDGHALLRLLAWFAPDPIPESLLDVPVPSLNPSVCSTGAEERTRGWPKGAGESHAALANLEAYSLVMRDGDTPSFTVHRLVQDVTRSRMRCRVPVSGRTQSRASSDCAPNELDAALRWINAALVGEPQDVRSWPTLDPLANHALACAQHADDAQIADPSARIMTVVGVLLITKAQYSRAEPLLRRTLGIDEHKSGLEHPDVANDLVNLAALLTETNRGVEAEPLIRRALDIWERSLGPKHPKVGVALSNLASLLHAKNELAEAERFARRALAIDEQNYGSAHPDVATKLNNLAQLLQATTRLAEAEPLMRRALNIDERAYGNDHPAVARDLNNLARLLLDTNRLSEAEPLLRRALAIFEKSLGKNHPSVAIAFNSLALILKTTNRLADAESLIRQAIIIDEECYGKDHPQVARSLNSLASLLHDRNNLPEAEPLLRRALDIDERSYGRDHPAVAVHLNNLAQLLKAAGRFAEAEPLMRRTLAIVERSCGKDHPDVASALNNLAKLLQAARRFEEAEPPMRRMLETLLRFTRATGHEHPNLKTGIKNYTSLLGQMGRSPKRILTQLNNLGRAYGVQFGGSS